MSNLPSKKPTVSPGRTAPADENSPVAQPFDEQLRVFWEKNHQGVYFGVTLVLLAVIGRYAYEALAIRREAAIETSFSSITAPVRLEAFARDHDRHPLAGAAWIKLADEAYAAGRFAEALTRYEKVTAALPGTPFASRALLGRAACLIQTGKTAEGAAVLKQVADDNAELKGARCEAAYHLASLAFESGDYDTVVKRTDQVMQLDSAGTWAQPAILLRARTPVAPAPAAKPGEAMPAVSVKLPGT